MSASRRRKRRRIEATRRMGGVGPLFGWPEQQHYEVIRPLVLFAYTEAI
jgi:hypothetical protein